MEPLVHRTVSCRIYWNDFWKQNDTCYHYDKTSVLCFLIITVYNKYSSLTHKRAYREGRIGKMHPLNKMWLTFLRFLPEIWRQMRCRVSAPECEHWSDVHHVHLSSPTHTSAKQYTICANSSDVQTFAQSGTVKLSLYVCPSTYNFNQKTLPSYRQCKDVAKI